MRINKNGRTKEMKKLLKAFRIKQNGGGLLDLFSSNKPVETQKTQKQIEYETAQNAIYNAQAMDKALAVAKVATGAIVAAELLTNAAEPLLAASGVGIPLLAILVVAKKLAKQYKQNLELNAVLLDVIVIIKNCFFLEALIKKTMSEFDKPFRDALTAKTEVPVQEPNAIAGGGLPNQPQPNGAIEESIKIKLDELNKLLQSIAPQEPDKNKRLDFDRINRGFKRFFFSAELKNQIITKLTVINGLFTIYNSQFDWSLRFYESKILNNLSNGKEIIKEIWENIEKSKEYTDYLFQPSSNDPETAAGEVVDPQLAQNPEAQKNIEAEIDEAANTTEQPIQQPIQQPMQQPMQQPIQEGGRRKTNKHKRRRAGITRKRSRK